MLVICIGVEPEAMNLAERVAPEIEFQNCLRRDFVGKANFLPAVAREM